MIFRSVGKKSVLFADGIAPGEGTSTSGGEETTPLPLRDRNKRKVKKKLESKRRRMQNLKRENLNVASAGKEEISSATNVIIF